MVNAIIFVFCKVTAFTWKFYFLVYFFRTFCDFILAGKSQWPLALTMFGGVWELRMSKWKNSGKYMKSIRNTARRLIVGSTDSETTRNFIRPNTGQLARIVKSFPHKHFHWNNKNNNKNNLPILSNRTSLIRYRLIDSVSKLYYT